MADTKRPLNAAAEETVTHLNALNPGDIAGHSVRRTTIALTQPTMKKTLLDVQAVTLIKVTKNAMLAYLDGEQTIKRDANIRLLSDILPFNPIMCIGITARTTAWF